ncbi:MAG TPA: NADH-quinone oxidoreductase subunit L [Candidatus Omnitrophota bacterium]|nr:NADH-quinone oxidoreductase subunit L [Candidatus Omnitrophota bacterium]
MTDLFLLWTIQLAPLLAFLAIQVLPIKARRPAPAIGILFSLIAAAASLWLLFTHLRSEGLSQQFVYRWLVVADTQLFQAIPVQNYTLVVGFLLDPLNLLMINLVTTISLFVQIFSFYYMNEDPSRPRYFAFLSFFSFTMTGLVLSNNLLQTFLFWELVGLASYLLIGFWYEKESAAKAAKKAFVVNRVGDLGFYLGIITLFLLYGTLNFTQLTPEFLNGPFNNAVVTALGVLIFMGVMGKSAQFPLHAWLPDAMEGPTPVSALIHSATMVAAGVFLLCRAWGLFSASAMTLMIILAIGACTAFIGASLATIQRDIKKIMAYSTISQLGFMVMGIGAGSHVAGMFHLSTHAFFKSLLFLTSGAFIHHFHTNDIWEIGKKGGKRLVIPMAALCVGLFSLCGIFPFSGFFSKDMILEVLKEKSSFFYGLALAVSFLTVYYSFRMLFVILFSKEDHKHHDAHHSPAILNLAEGLPLVSLAVISLFVGALGTPLFHSAILHWLGGHEMHLDTQILVTTLALIAGGAALAYFQFRDPQKALAKLEAGKGPVRTLLDKRFYIDDLYDFLVEQVSHRISGVFDWCDRVIINGLMVNQTAFSIMRLGKVASKLQNGLLQDYLSLAVGAGVVIIFWILKTV